MQKNSLTKEHALKFVILLGFVSLFADVTYEGARSITGPFLATLGASGAVVGIVAGFGELIGYGLRLVSGYITDRTKQYWTITLVGYAVNLTAVPLLAFAGRWDIAVCLIIAERMGKAIRTPARDAMLSHATKEMGRGFGFGLHEAMDQIGAMMGPVVVALVLAFKGGYHAAFAILFIPALAALSILLRAKYLYPRPHDFEPVAVKIETRGFSRSFWIYLAAVSLMAAGYVDFPLIAFHFKKISLTSDTWIPLFYALAMGVDAIAALVFGKCFDKWGIPVLIVAACLSAVFPPLVFFGNLFFVGLGMVLWGIGMGAQESIMRAVVADLAPSDRRGSAYGIFNAGYGLFWFLGSALIGILYDFSIVGMVFFSVGAQLASIPLMFAIARKK